MLRTSFSTLGCPDWSFEEMVVHGAAAGFDGVEIRLVQRETDLLQVPAFASSEISSSRQFLADHHFSVCGLASSVSFDSPDVTVRNRQIATGRAYLDLAAALGAGFIRVFGDVVLEGCTRQALVEQVAEGLNLLGEYAESLQLEVLIETHGDFAQSDLVVDTFRRVESPAAGVLWDTHHPWRFFGESLPESLHLLAPYVRHTHWKDSISSSRGQEDQSSQSAAEAAHALMGGHMHANYVLFGGGEFPILECLNLLANANYTGWYSYEWEKMWHPELESPELAFPLFPRKLAEFHDLAVGR